MNVTSRLRGMHLGKLPYDAKLRAPEEKRRRLQGFAQAAAESFGSSSTAAPWNSHGSEGKREEHQKQKGCRGKGGAEETEVASPPKYPTGASQEKEKNVEPGGACQQVDSAKRGEMGKQAVRKQKNKSSGSASDLNLPVGASSAIIPHGLVLDRVSQLATNSGVGVKADELLKKQKMTQNQDARSAAAAGGSPRRAQ